jgi:hypothetical protein
MFFDKILHRIFSLHNKIEKKMVLSQTAPFSYKVKYIYIVLQIKTRR